MLLTARLDLRGGRSFWPKGGYAVSDPAPSSSDIVVVGAGIMGAMVALRLVRSGRSVAVVDRRVPATGATAASTALVMWGADTPLIKLSEAIGVKAAGAKWRRLLMAVQDLNQLIADEDIACNWRARPELYLAGGVLDEAALQLEGEARRAAELPSEFFRAQEVAARFDIPARAGLVSAGCYEVDPIALTCGLLDRARRAGATLSHPIAAERLEHVGDEIDVHCGEGCVIRARHVILATGYEAARLFLPPGFSLSSSYAIASKPGHSPSRGEHALIWESADPYAYARAAADGRIIVGGEDEAFSDPERRDALLPQKRAALEVKAAALLGCDDIEFEYAWSATFGKSPDGLPALGPARGASNVYLAYGFGGNGVTFAALGADVMRRLIEGVADEDFDPYRPLGEVKKRAQP